MSSTFVRKLLFGATISLGFMLTTTAWSQSYPNRAVRLVVPFVAGGAIDVTARRLAEYLSTKSPQQFIVENTVGASGVVGARRVARADPDGYTLLFGTTSVYAINPAINPRKGMLLGFRSSSHAFPVSSDAVRAAPNRRILGKQEEPACAMSGWF